MESNTTEPEMYMYQVKLNTIKNSFIIIESPVFIPPTVCEKVLNAKSTPFIATYNPVINKIDVKGEVGGFSDLRRDKTQYAKMDALVIGPYMILRS